MDDEWRTYEGAVTFVDPSGRGKDETAWAVMKSLNGVLYLLKVGHEVSGPTKAMVEIATYARRYGVHMIEVEPNFGQGMWVAAFQPILAKIWAKGGATVQESEWARVRKRPGLSTRWSRCSRCFGATRISRGTDGLQTRRWSKADSNLYGAFPVK